MSSLFTIRVGDRTPWLAYDFGFSLAGVLGVTFSARDEDTGVVFINRQPAVVANGTYTLNGAQVTYTPASGVVFYPWAPSDTAQIRPRVSGLFHLDWGAGQTETVPSEGLERIMISENF